MTRRSAAVLWLLLAGSLAGCSHLARKASIAYMAVATQLLPDDVHIVLQRSFLETYKNRVTIRANFTVDAVSGSPNPGVFDGDLHFAGRVPEIGLRLVGEIMNAASVEAAVEAVKRAKSSRSPLDVTGVWRLWPEHVLGTQQQGRPVAPLTNPNPDHAFEINPITRLGNLDLLPTFHPVEGYSPGNAGRTFGIYENVECMLRFTPETVTLITPPGLYNDVHFLLQPREERHLVVGDGRFVPVRALDLEGNLLVERVRTVFVKGSAPERAVRSLKRGARLHVWGRPRVDFAEISRRVTAAAAADSAALKGKLPYEIVVLGVYPAEK